MKMVQRLYPDNAKKTEVFYDGVVRIQQPEGIVEFTKAHWHDSLWELGYRDLPDESEVGERPSPKRQIIKKGKVTNNGTDNKQSE